MSYGDDFAIDDRVVAGSGRLGTVVETSRDLVVVQWDSDDEFTYAFHRSDRWVRKVVAPDREVVLVDSDARCRVCNHFELDYARTNAQYAHCPSCGRAPHWLQVKRLAGRPMTTRPILMSAPASDHAVVHRPAYPHNDCGCRACKQAPLARNTLIVNQADEIHLWPAPWSRGTFDTLRKAIKSGKPHVLHEPWRKR